MRKYIYLFLLVSLLFTGCRFPVAPNNSAKIAEEVFFEKICSKSWTNKNPKINKTAPDSKNIYYSQDEFFYDKNLDRIIYILRFSKTEDYLKKSGSLIKVTYIYKINGFKQDILDVTLYPETIRNQANLYVSDSYVHSFYNSVSNSYNVKNCPNKLIVNGQEEFN